MRSFFLFLFLTVSAIAQTRYVTNAAPTIVGILLSDGSVIASGTGVLTNNGTGYSWVSVGGGGGGSQTPWLSHINAAGYHLTNGSSFLSLADDATFGITNGESAGVGANINLVSHNGRIVFGPYSGGGTDGETAKAFTLNSPFGHQMQISDGSDYDSTSGNGFWYFDAGSDGGTGTIVFLSNNEQSATFVSKLNRSYFQIYAEGSGQFSFFGVTDSGVFFCQPSSGATIFEIGDGSDPGDGSGLLPMRAQSGWFGAESSDSTSALLQSAADISAAGSYWAQGIQGVSGTMLDGSTVTGGMITHIGP